MLSKRASLTSTSSVCSLKCMSSMGSSTASILENIKPMALPDLPSVPALLARNASFGLDGQATPVDILLGLKVMSASPDPPSCADAVVIIPSSSNIYDQPTSNEQEEVMVNDEVSPDSPNATHSLPVAEDVPEVSEDGNKMAINEEPMEEDSADNDASTSADTSTSTGGAPLDITAPPMPFTGPAPIEIIISFDTTGSMSYYLDEVKAQIQDIIQRLFMDIPNLRIGIMAHGDYCDEKVYYLMQKMDFTNDVNTLCQFVKDVEGTGGGDFEECYELVLSEVRSLPWSPGTQRSLVMIGDAIPHDTDYALNKNKLDWRREADALYHDMGVKVYAVQCQDEKGAAPFWKELAERTNGQHLKLDQFSTIVDILMAICYREHGTEYFDAYEKEVRSRDGPHMACELDSAFDTLRGRPGPSAISKKVTFDWSKGARKNPAPKARGRSLVPKKPAPPKPKPVAVRKTAAVVVKGVVKKNTPASSASVAMATRRSAKSLGTSDRKQAHVATKNAIAKKVGDKKKTAPKKIIKKHRELVPRTKFILKDLKWSPWKLGMAKEDSENDDWQPRRKDCVGFRNTSLFKIGSDKPAIYEFAVQREKQCKKYVMYSKVTRGFSGMHWDTFLLKKDNVEEEINNILQNGCKLFVRRALIDNPCQINGKTLRKPREYQTLLTQTYDYAWKFAFRSGETKSHRQIERNGVALSMGLDQCNCVMCWKPSSTRSKKQTVSKQCSCIMCWNAPGTSGQ